MPSHYEPSGLNQMFSLKYGTVPVVRATGGLDDTVEQFDPKTLKGTGFKFREYLGEVMLETLRAAAALYRSRQECLADVDAQWHGAGLLLDELGTRVCAGV